VTFRLFAAAAILLVHATASAAETAASEVAHLLVPREAWSQGLDGLGQQVQTNLTAHPGAKLEYPADFPKTVRTELEKAFPYEEMVGVHAKELGAAFSEPELKDLAAFFRSPSGAKFLRASGSVQDKVGAATQQKIQGKMPDLMSRLSKLAKAPAGAGSPDAKLLQLPPGHPTTGGTASPEPAAAKKAEPAKK
jgi:hypothetical protein